MRPHVTAPNVVPELGADCTGSVTPRRRYPGSRVRLYSASSALFWLASDCHAVCLEYYGRDDNQSAKLSPRVIGRTKTQHDERRDGIMNRVLAAMICLLGFTQGIARSESIGSIAIEEALIFATPAGEVVNVKPGGYTIDVSQSDILSLVSPEGDNVTVEATSGSRSGNRGADYSHCRRRRKVGVYGRCFSAQW